MERVGERNEEMESMMRRLHFAVIEGNGALLSTLLHEDPLILDKFQLSQANYSTSPLHIIAKFSHVEFANIILRAKPKLAGEVDSNKSSPLRLSCEYGHLHIVKALLSVSPDMCLACDIQGRNPLHLAVIKGQLDVVKELVLAVPQAVRECMDYGGTILHLSVKYNQFEVLKYLVDEVVDKEFLNEKDNKGNTILHLARANKQVIIEFLVTNGKVFKYELNQNRFTAVDLFVRSARDSPEDKDIRDVVRKAKLRKTSSIRAFIRASVDICEQQKEGLLVAASLFAAMAFQAVTNPPGGFWQNDQNSGAKNSLTGTSIMTTLHKGRYHRYIICTSLSFLSSMSVIIILIMGWSGFGHISALAFMLIAMSGMIRTYLYAIEFVTPFAAPLQLFLSILAIPVATTALYYICYGFMLLIAVRRHCSRRSGGMHHRTTV